MRQKLSVIVGGYLGDEGKGRATQKYLSGIHQRKRLCIRSSGGTNTGATVYSMGHKLSIHMLPVGAFMPDVDSYIGNGVYVNFDILLTELEMRRTCLSGVEEFLPSGRVFLSKFAHVVTQDCLDRDAEKESKQKLGSTKNGVSIAAADKYSYKGVTVEQWLNANQDFASKLEKLGLEIIDPYLLFTEIITPQEYEMVLEGTQGVGLDINHGFHYPYVSSGSFSPFGLLDGVGYALYPTSVCMVLKAYGSYFGPQRMGAADFDDDDFRKFAGEFGTTTGRPRNLCWLDMRKIQRVSSVVNPTEIMLNCVDLLNYFPEYGKSWKVYLDDSQSISFEDKPIHNARLTNAGALFIETIQEFAHAKVKYIGIGPKLSDIIELN